MAYFNGLAYKKKVIHQNGEPDAFKLAVWLNNAFQLAADMTHSSEQAVLNCQKCGKWGINQDISRKHKHTEHSMWSVSELSHGAGSFRLWWDQQMHYNIFIDL